MKPSKYNLETLVKLLVITVLQSKNLNFWLSSQLKEGKQRLEICFSDLKSFNYCREDISANDLAKLLTLLFKDTLKVKFSINKNFLSTLPRQSAKELRKKFYFTKVFNPQKYLFRVANGLEGKKPSPLVSDLKIQQLHKKAELVYQFYLDNKEKDLFSLSLEYLSQVNSTEEAYITYLKSFGTLKNITKDNFPKSLDINSLLDARLIFSQDKEPKNSYENTLLSPLVNANIEGDLVLENHDVSLDNRGTNNLVKPYSRVLSIDSSIDKVEHLINQSRLTLTESLVSVETKGRKLKNLLKEAKTEIYKTETLLKKEDKVDLESIFTLEDKKFQINEIKKTSAYNEVSFCTALPSISVVKESHTFKDEFGFVDILFSKPKDSILDNRDTKKSLFTSSKDNSSNNLIVGFSSEFIDSNIEERNIYPQINTFLDANKYIVSGSDNGITESGEIIPLNSDRARKLKLYGCDLHNYNKLDNFIISSFNNVAYSTLQAYAEKICKQIHFAAKVIYLNGNTGVGKTQLCQQILASLQESNLHYKEMYFYNDFKKTFSMYACQHKLDALKEEILGRQISIIDNWDSLTDKSKEFICNLIEEYKGRKDQLLIIVGKEKTHKILTETSYNGNKFSLVEQVLFGLPDTKFREFYFRDTLSEYKVTLSANSFSLLMEASEGRGIRECQSFIRELSLGTYSFEQLLETRMAKTVAVAIDSKTVISLVREVTGVTFEQLVTKSRKKETTFYRMLTAYALSQLGDYSISAIARILEQANSTIRNAINKAEIADSNNEHNFVSVYSQIKARAHEEYLNSFK